MKTHSAALAALFLSAQTFGSTDQIARLEPSPSTPFHIAGKGVINSAGHPMHPGSVHTIDVTVRLAIDPVAAAASIEVESGQGDEKDVDRYFVRRGRIFQVDDKGLERAPEPLADLSVAALAAIHPMLVAGAMRENRQNLSRGKSGSYLFAANDALWTVAAEKGSDRIASISRLDFDEVAGDGVEELIYERAPARVTVSKRGRTTASFTFDPPELAPVVAIPAGDEHRERGHAISKSEIDLKELAPHLYTIELASLNTRVTVAEFADFLVVIEGAYDARVGDLLVSAIKEKLGMPIRYHAFSHLHGQYIGSTRAFVAEGATIVVPPTTAPMIEEMAAAPHALRPDRLSASPKKPSIETVKTERRIEDGTNALTIFNVVSEHTDEYFVFWFPGQKILLTGDLLFYRPGKPLTGRSKRVCLTVSERSLEPERLVATWPLDGFGTKNVVTGAEFRAACESSP